MVSFAHTILFYTAYLWLKILELIYIPIKYFVSTTHLYTECLLLKLLGLLKIPFTYFGRHVSWIRSAELFMIWDQLRFRQLKVNKKKEILNLVSHLLDQKMSANEIINEVNSIGNVVVFFKEWPKVMKHVKGKTLGISDGNLLTVNGFPLAPSCIAAHGFKDGQVLATHITETETRIEEILAAVMQKCYKRGDISKDEKTRKRLITAFATASHEYNVKMVKAAWNMSRELKWRDLASLPAVMEYLSTYINKHEKDLLGPIEPSTKKERKIKLIEYLNDPKLEHYKECKDSMIKVLDEIRAANSNENIYCFKTLAEALQHVRHCENDETVAEFFTRMRSFIVNVHSTTVPRSIYSDGTENFEYISGDYKVVLYKLSPTGKVWIRTFYKPNKKRLPKSLPKSSV